MSAKFIGIPGICSPVHVEIPSARAGGKKAARGDHRKYESVEMLNHGNHLTFGNLLTRQERGSLG